MLRILFVSCAGKTAQSIIVGAHYERSTSSNRPFDAWSGAALLPDLYHCLSDKERRHTIIFVAFADRRDSVAGAETFAAHMTVPELAHTEAMVNLDVLGLSPTKVWPNHSDKELIHLLMVMVYAMKIPASQVISVWRAEAIQNRSRPGRFRKSPSTP